jgi:hypothetical protein
LHTDEEEKKEEQLASEKFAHEDETPASSDFKSFKNLGSL